MASSSACSSYVKLSIGASNDNYKCIWFDTKFTKCQIPTSKFNKLEHILALYEDIEALVLVIDCPVNEWKITKPVDAIKHLYLDARAKFCDRPGVLPENIWLMFPNLETLIITNVFLPVDNLDTLQNLYTFRLIHGASKVKRHDTRIQEIVQILAGMNTLNDLQIWSDQPCQIPDDLFRNNPNLQYIDFDRKVFCDNIPSITNCRELILLSININILANPYILELSGLSILCIIDYFTDTPIPDEIFAKPIFTTSKTRGHIKTDFARFNTNGVNYKTNIGTRCIAVPIWRSIGNNNFRVLM